MLADRPREETRTDLHCVGVCDLHGFELSFEGAQLAEIRFFARHTGPAISPFNAFLFSIVSPEQSFTDVLNGQDDLLSSVLLLVLGLTLIF